MDVSVRLGRAPVVERGRRAAREQRVGNGGYRGRCMIMSMSMITIRLVEEAPRSEF